MAWKGVVLWFFALVHISVAQKWFTQTDPLSDPEKLLAMDDVLNFDYLKDLEDIINSKFNIESSQLVQKDQKPKNTDTHALSFSDLINSNPVDVEVQITPELFPDLKKVKSKRKKVSKKVSLNSGTISLKTLMELDRFMHSHSNRRLDEEEGSIDKLDPSIYGRAAKNKEAVNVLSLVERQPDAKPELSSALKHTLKSFIKQLEKKNEETNTRHGLMFPKTKKYQTDDEEPVNPGPLMKLKPLVHSKKQNITGKATKKKTKKGKLSDKEIKTLHSFINLERLIRPKLFSKQRVQLDRLKDSAMFAYGRNRKPNIEGLTYASGDNNSIQNCEDGSCTEQATTEYATETEIIYVTDTTETDTTEMCADVTETEIIEEFTTEIETETYIEEVTVIEVEVVTESYETTNET